MFGVTLKVKMYNSGRTVLFRGFQRIVEQWFLHSISKTLVWVPDPSLPPMMPKLAGAKERFLPRGGPIYKKKWDFSIFQIFTI